MWAAMPYLSSGAFQADAIFALLGVRLRLPAEQTSGSREATA
jgi:hypothetical protein